MYRKHRKIITDFNLKGYTFEKKLNRIYTSAQLEVKLSIPLDKICYVIIKRYQAGEVNSIEYADSVRLDKKDLFLSEKNNSFIISTDELGYGKSVKPIKYYLLPQVVYSFDGKTLCYSEKTPVFCINTPDGEKTNNVFKE